MAELFEETERIKLRFIQAYERLHELGKVSAQELEDVIDALDRIDDLSPDELAQRLSKFKSVEPEASPSAEERGGLR